MNATVEAPNSCGYKQIRYCNGNFQSPCSSGKLSSNYLVLGVYSTCSVDYKCVVPSSTSAVAEEILWIGHMTAILHHDHLTGSTSG